MGRPLTVPPSVGTRARRWQAAQRRWQATRHRWRHSLRWRLVTLFLLLALATTAIFLAGMQRVLRGGWQGTVQPLAADYLDRLAAELGTPPDPARARALAERLPITIRIDGPSVRFDSHPGATPGWRGDRGSDRTSGSDDNDDGPGWGRTTADGHRIRFGLVGAIPGDGPRLTGWLTLAALLLLTALAYATVRRMLRPLDEIGAGVERYGAGDFTQRITAVRRDELGELADRINRMTDSLHGMLDAKRALLLAISHELRSPLTRARVNAELVDEGPPRDALLRDLGEMRDLVADLLDGERLSAGHAALHTEAVDLPALLRETAAAQAGPQAIELVLDEALGPLRVDPVRMRLLARNLIDNALRHGRPAMHPPRVELARESDGRLRLAVRDFGPGVSEDQLGHLAEPFYRADSARQRSTGGVGLGLHLCRLVALAHGGELAFRRGQPGLEVTMRWRPAAA